MPTNKAFKKRWAEYLLLAGISGIIIMVGFFLFVMRPLSPQNCKGIQWYNVCIPQMHQPNIHGLDISHYQGAINWQQLQQAQQAPVPLRFIFMKATEGETLADSLFQRNFALARQHGFIRGAYHYFLPSKSVVQQALFFIKNVKLQDGDLPPVLDVEVTNGKSPKELQHLVLQWMHIVEQHYKVKPILYASFKFRLRYLDNPTIAQYPYWIAHYHVDSVLYQGKWHFWQHTDKANVPGILPAVDLNIFNGGIEELKLLTIGSIKATTP